MPIYEYYCPDNHRIYQFYARTLAQGRTIPKCPDNAKYRMEKVVSAFAVVGGAQENDGAAPAGKEADASDPKLDSAMAAMEREFSSVDENDPRAMGRMMRRMAELSGDAIPPDLEEVVRKLEEGADPESLEDQMGADADGGADPEAGGAPGDGAGAETAAERKRRRAARGPARRDPKLYDYE